MSTAFELLLKLLPLYILIPLGLCIAKTLRIEKKQLSLLLIYCITPVVIFDGTFSADITPTLLLLPVITFFLCCTICALAYFVSKFLWRDATRNIFAFTSGTGNTGYFGLPVAISLFGESILGTYVMALFGFILYENTIGFFVTARGSFTAQESLFKVLKLPTVYAFILGLSLNFLHVIPPHSYVEMATMFRGTYTVIGMMIIGLALSEVSLSHVDYTFMGATTIMKFIIWPVLTLATFQVIYVDSSTLQVLLLLSIVPLASNTVALASALSVEPQKSAIAVLQSTIFALFYIPFFVTFLM